eukprot:TRINITY_DN1443_c0_g1_i1.p1 TRINITY_DN1443_c0_g1~~TRINITY_DN1443_c0_g1_i1.p1  ORF type:complete len:1645 (+),score=584.34 TRINITY_DN1443_c0_g1_i1:114-4937(+)
MATDHVQPVRGQVPSMSLQTPQRLHIDPLVALTEEGTDSSEPAGNARAVPATPQVDLWSPSLQCSKPPPLQERRSTGGDHSMSTDDSRAVPQSPEWQGSIASRPAVGASFSGISRPAKSVATTDLLDEDQAPLSLRERANLLFSDPSSSVMARFVSGFFLVLIVLSTMAFLLETVPELSADPHFGDPARACMWFMLETVCIAFFTFEYIIRWVTEPLDSIMSFPFEPFNIVDLIAILPYYFELLVNTQSSACTDPAKKGEAQSEGVLGSFDLRFIRVVRLARVFRVLKLGRGLNATEVLLNTFRASQQALMVPFFFLLLGMVVFSSLMYLFEQGTYNKEDGRYYIVNSQGHEVEAMFPSIPDTLWWAIVTMTTVGYGDQYPQTAIGKTINSAAMMFGTLFFAMPIAIVGAEFTTAWEQKRGNVVTTTFKRGQRKREIRPNTKEWSNTELNHFNIYFSEENVSMDEFFGFSDRRKDSLLTYRFEMHGISGSPQLLRRATTGLFVELEVLEFKGQCGTVCKDEGLVLQRVATRNPLVEQTRSGQFVGRRLLSVRTGGERLDLTRRDVLRDWQRKHPRGDTHSAWADSWLHSMSLTNDRVVFEFETEQEVGDRMMRLVPPHELVPDHFNASLFARAKKAQNAKRLRRDLAVPPALIVSSDRAPVLDGVYWLEPSMGHRHPRWTRRGESPAELRSDHDQWTIRLSADEATVLVRSSAAQHGGNLPHRTGGWTCRTDSPRARYLASAGTVVRDAPGSLKVISGDEPYLQGRYMLLTTLDPDGQPRWQRSDDPDDAHEPVDSPHDMQTAASESFAQSTTLCPEDSPPAAIYHSDGSWLCTHIGEDEQPLKGSHTALRCDASGGVLPGAGAPFQQQWEHSADGGWRPCEDTVVQSGDGRRGRASESLCNLAYKVYHMKRSVSSSYRYADPTSAFAEKNIDMYTKDFIVQLYHHVGLARLPTGFRSKAGLKIYYGKEMVRSKHYQMDDTKEVTFASDSDIGVFGLALGKVVPVYCVANEALLEDEDEKKGRIAGELLSLAQNLWLNCNKPADFKCPVYLVTYRGTRMRFYTAAFPAEYLDIVSKGMMPSNEMQVRVRSFPNRRERGRDQEFCLCEHARKSADDVFPESWRQLDTGLAVVNLTLSLDPKIELQDGQLKYVALPEADDFRGTTPLRIVRIDRGPYGPPGAVKIGQRLTQIKEQGARQVTRLNSRKDYDEFIWQKCMSAKDPINVVVSIAEDYDSVDFLEPRERAVSVEMLQRLRLRILKYLSEDVDGQFSFSPGSVKKRNPSRIDPGSPMGSPRGRGNASTPSMLSGINVSMVMPPRDDSTVQNSGVQESGGVQDSGSQQQRVCDCSQVSQTGSILRKNTAELGRPDGAAPPKERSRARTIGFAQPAAGDGTGPVRQLSPTAGRQRLEQQRSCSAGSMPFQSELSTSRRSWAPSAGGAAPDGAPVALRPARNPPQPGVEAAAPSGSPRSPKVLQAKGSGQTRGPRARLSPRSRLSNSVTLPQVDMSETSPMGKSTSLTSPNLGPGILSTASVSSSPPPSPPAPPPRSPTAVTLPESVSKHPLETPTVGVVAGGADPPKLTVEPQVEIELAFSRRTGVSSSSASQPSG